MLEGLIRSIEKISEGLHTWIPMEEFRKDQAMQSLVCDLQREQLMDGMRSDGRQITPSMSQDPFFKKPGSAVRYAERKYRQFGPSRRDFMTPNLIITGTFHEGFRPEFNLDGVFMDNSNRVMLDHTGRGTTDLYAKYGQDTFGLTEGNWDRVLDEFRPGLINSLREIIYG